MTKSPLDSDVDHFPETFEAKFRADTATIPPVRLELQNWLRAAGLESVVGDVVLVCDELMANAAVHGCRGLPPDTELAVTVKWCAGRLRVIVSDPSSEKPREQGDSDSRPSGRGLKLVGAFSECWGVDEAPDRHGKSVWANVHAQTPSPSRKYCPTKLARLSELPEMDGHIAVRPLSAVSTPTSTDVGPGRGPGPDTNVHRGNR